MNISSSLLPAHNLIAKKSVFHFQSAIIDLQRGLVRTPRTPPPKGLDVPFSLELKVLDIFWKKIRSEHTIRAVLLNLLNILRCDIRGRLTGTNNQNEIQRPCTDFNDIFL